MTNLAGQKSVRFYIKSVYIHNIGSIDSLHLNFEDQNFTALYGGNGIGKTTLLECLSVLGHVPCFPTYNSEDQLVDSLVSQKFGNGNESRLIDYEKYLGLSNIAHLGYSSWIEQRKENNSGPIGFIEFEISDYVSSNTKASNKFCVFVHQFKFNSSERMSLTSMLSRGEFDDLPFDSQFSDDRFLSGCGLVVYDPNNGNQTAQTYHELCKKIARGRTFSIYENKKSKTYASQRIMELPDTFHSRAITYLNTDLNDFGRGNDLRESPKDLERDFGAEMVTRLRLEFDEEFCYKYLDELGEICRDILETPHTHYSDDRAIPPSFKLDALRVDSKMELLVNRMDGGAPLPLGHLSAGENEVFFVMLLLLNFTRNDVLGDSIIILDEPDLHIAKYARTDFFKHLIKLVENKAQTIIASHSPSLFENIASSSKDREKRTKVLFRRLKSVDEIVTQLQAEYDGVFLWNLTVDKDRAVFRNLIKRVRMFTAFQFARTKAALKGSPPYSAAICLASVIISSVGLLFLTLGAVLNDTLNSETLPAVINAILFFGATPVEYHDITRRWYAVFIVTLLTPILTISFLRRRRNKLRSNNIDRVRDQ